MCAVTNHSTIMLSVKKRSWELDFAENSNAYTGYTAITNSVAVLRYWGISDIKMGNRQGETLRIVSHVSFLCLAPTSLSTISHSHMSLSPISLSPMSLACLAPLTLPWLSSLCLPSKRDRGERQGS